TAADPGPRSGNHDAVGRGLGHGWLRLERLGRRRQELHVGLFGERPIARRITAAAIDLGPGSGHPLPGRVRDAPNAAECDIVIAIIIPRPIARDPLDVLAGGLLVGWYFFDRIGRAFGHGAGSFGLEVDRFGISFVHRPARLNLNSFLLESGLIRGVLTATGE